MALVVDDTASRASAVRGMTSTETARQQILGHITQKGDRIAQVKAAIERKQREQDELQREIETLRAEREEDGNYMLDLKEKKLVYRVFADIDRDRKGTISPASFNEFDAETRRAMDDRLFAQIPKTYVVKLRTEDLIIPDVQASIADAIQVNPDAVFVGVPDGHFSGAVTAQFRLLWHMAPETVRKGPPPRTESQIELRKAECEAYFGMMGGTDAGVPPGQGRAKEQEFFAAIQKCVTDCGCEYLGATEEGLATFDDFRDIFWLQTPDSHKPAALVSSYEEAQLKERDTVLPEEAMDKVTQLEQQIKEQHRKNNATRKETADCIKDIQAIDKKIHAHHKELVHIQQVTGYDSSSSRPKSVDFDTQVAQVRELRALVARLREEHVKGQQILRKKTQVIAELTRELEEKQEFEERLYQAMNDDKVAAAEIREIEAQLEEMRGEHAKSDRAIIALDGKRDRTAVECLKLDKEYLSVQVQRHSQKRMEQKNVVNAQSRRLEHLAAREAAITNAMKALDLWTTVQARLKDAMVSVASLEDGRDPCNLEHISPTLEVVDVELFELLQRYRTRIEDAVSKKRLLLSEKADCGHVLDQTKELARRNWEEEEDSTAAAIEKYARQVKRQHRQAEEQHAEARRWRDKWRRELAEVRTKALQAAKAKSAEAQRE